MKAPLIFSRCFYSETNVDGLYGDAYLSLQMNNTVSSLMGFSKNLILLLMPTLKTQSSDYCQSALGQKG